MSRMTRSALISFFILPFISSYAQYDAECFNNTKKQIKLAIEEEFSRPTDSVRFRDSLYIGGVMRYVDTVIYRYQYDANPIVQRIVGCRMPDFTFFTINKDEMSVNAISSDFTLITFSSTTYGDVCNARLQQYCRLKKALKDSLTVINIFEDPDKKVIDYAMNYESNVEFVANADVLTSRYSLNTGAQIFLLDRYKNIIYINAGQRYRDTPDEIYSELLDKMREYSCSD
jgi:cytochrome oxidase Cu insertion factor (SCO1/SenC/PrrC family)